MLQTLSKDKAFGKSLNKVFDGHASLPVNIRIHNFHGTYGDYLICVCIFSVQFNTLRTCREAMAQKKLTLRKKNSERRLCTISLQRPNEL